MEQNEKIKLLIVDDSNAYRTILKTIASKDPGIELIGTAENGKKALEIIKQNKPDVVTLDIEMPEMNGIETLKKIKEIDSNIQVLMLSSLTEYGGQQTLTALSNGAADFLPKSFIEGNATKNVQLIKNELLERIRLLYKHKQIQTNPEQITSSPEDIEKITQKIPNDIKMVVIGVSAGGYNSIQTIIPKLEKEFSLPIVIIQQMPDIYLKDFIEEVKKVAKLPVKPVADNFPIFNKYIYLGTTDHLIDMELHGKYYRFKLQDKSSAHPDTAKNPINVFFQNITKKDGLKVIGILLKFSGGDGIEGLRMLKATGSFTIIQDSEMLGIGETQFADLRAPIEIIPKILNKIGVKK